MTANKNKKCNQRIESKCLGWERNQLGGTYDSNKYSKDMNFI